MTNLLKCATFTIVFSFCYITHAQRGSIGFGSPGPYFPDESQAQRAKFEQTLKVQLAGDQPIRVSNGRAVNIIYSDNWMEITGIVHAQEGEVLIISETKDLLNTGRLLAITNAPHYTDQQHVRFLATRVGMFAYGNARLILWDRGIPYIPPPPTPEQIKAIQEAQQRRIASMVKAKNEAVIRVLKWNQDQAAAGDAYGQLRMGERYRDGDGVETNLVKARTYFTLSAAQGNKTAQNELSGLSGQ